MTDDIQNLIERACKRDVHAFGRIVERFQDMAVGYGYAILGDLHLAQDAAQEAFLEAYGNLSRIHTPAAFPSLLRRIVFKHCDRLTRRDRKFRVLPLDAAADRVSQSPGPEEQLASRETCETVRQAIETLSESERVVVSLFYMSDYRQQEIAGFLDVPVTTVNTRLYTARKRLKERLISMVEDELHESRPSKDARFVDSVLNVIAPDPEQDAEKIYSLFSEKLHRPDMETQVRLGRIDGSHYNWHTSRIGLLNDEIITHIGVYDLEVRIGTTFVRMAGINVDYDISSEENKPSFFDQTMSDVLAAMQAGGYDMSMVRASDPAMYASHGYVYAMPVEWTYSVKTEDLPNEPSDLRMEEIFYNDLHSRPDVIELYNREYEHVTMTSVRPTYHRSKCPIKPGEYGPSFLLYDKADQVVGYIHDPFVWDAKTNKDITIFESAGDPEQRLRLIAETARKYGVEEIAFIRLPPGGPLARRIRQCRRYSVIIDKGGSGTKSSPMRIINLSSTLAKLSGELTRRLGESSLHDWTGNLSITVDDETAALDIKQGKVSAGDTTDTPHRIQGDQEIVRLLIGTDHPEIVVEEAGIRLSGDADRLIRALFPAQDPVMPNEDL